MCRPTCRLYCAPNEVDIACPSTFFHGQPQSASASNQPTIDDDDSVCDNEPVIAVSPGKRPTPEVGDDDCPGQSEKLPTMFHVSDTAGYNVNVRLEIGAAADAFDLFPPATVWFPK